MILALAALAGTPAIAAELSAGETAWGVAAQACLDRARAPDTPDWLRIDVVVSPDTGRLTMWAPPGVDTDFNLRRGCEMEANNAPGARPVPWKPPASPRRH